MAELSACSGVVNVLKPPGMSSHDVVAKIRKIYNCKRAGHSGTLDPAAAGVLPVFLGNATRFIEYFPGDKEYIAEILFGCSTDSLDYTGNVTAEAAVCGIVAVDVVSELSKYLGEIKQIPPLRSAVKVCGRKMYEYERKGVPVEIPERAVSIYKLDLLEHRDGVSKIHVHCSGGTYIRSLCRDVGAGLNTLAVMGFLLRTRTGIFGLDTARVIEDIGDNPAQPLADVGELLEKMYGAAVLDEMQARLFQDGVTLEYCRNDAAVLPVFYEGKFLGIATAQGGRLVPRKVIRIT